MQCIVQMFDYLAKTIINCDGVEIGPNAMDLQQMSMMKIPCLAKLTKSFFWAIIFISILVRHPQISPFQDSNLTVTTL